MAYTLVLYKMEGGSKTNGVLIDSALDPWIELSRLLSNHLGYEASVFSLPFIDEDKAMFPNRGECALVEAIIEPKKDNGNRSTETN